MNVIKGNIFNFKCLGIAKSLVFCCCSWFVFCVAVEVNCCSSRRSKATQIKARDFTTANRNRADNQSGNTPTNVERFSLFGFAKWYKVPGIYKQENTIPRSMGLVIFPWQVYLVGSGNIESF